MKVNRRTLSLLHGEMRIGLLQYKYKYANRQPLRSNACCSRLPRMLEFRVYLNELRWHLGMTTGPDLVVNYSVHVSAKVVQYDVKTFQTKSHQVPFV